MNRRTIIYIIAAIIAVMPFVKLAVSGYESVGAFIIALVIAAAVVFLCDTLASVLRRIEDVETREDAANARAAEHHKRIKALENKEK